MSVIDEMQGAAEPAKADDAECVSQVEVLGVIGEHRFEVACKHYAV
jgi:hypothetical protein